MRRGDIYELRLPPKGVGHEQQGRRFGAVVQSDALLPRTVVLIAPTSTSAQQASFRPAIEIDRQRTLVLVEHVGAVDVSRLGDLVGHLTQEELWGIDIALGTVLDL
ncbi:type II toxin-antitoxin system PemK/MazF family toxin [Candidatus Poriferisodalis sp.]|uniref:type II toxin-antitoxin system PemK/MazF family toxin n=1 Tax=Candidatus Poriferisodalis sp. TaxID=3101277 RepID=UPI003D14FEC7